MNEYLIDGIPLTLLNLALVQWIKQFNLSGNAVRLVSMGIGILLGVGYKLIYQNQPSTPASIFEAILFGIVLGLSASGLYDVGKSWNQSN